MARKVKATRTAAVVSGRGASFKARVALVSARAAIRPHAPKKQIGLRFVRGRRGLANGTCLTGQKKTISNVGFRWIAASIIVKGQGRLAGPHATE
jgi:hypothetical protein